MLSGEDEKRRARAQAVGLFRYQLICPALDAGLSRKARGRLVREIASREHTDPFGTPVRYSRDTLDRWIRRYRAGGFAELVPSARTCVLRTDTAVLEMAAALKREPADGDRVGALGIDPAAAVPPVRADRPDRRGHRRRGVRPVRGRKPQRPLDRGCPARPADRGP